MQEQLRDAQTALKELDPEELMEKTLLPDDGNPIRWRKRPSVGTTCPNTTNRCVAPSLGQ